MKKPRKRIFCEYCGSPLEKYLSVKSAAELLDCSERFFRKRIQNRTIGFSKIGGMIRIPHSEILKLMKRYDSVEEMARKILYE